MRCPHRLVAITSIFTTLFFCATSLSKVPGRLDRRVLARLTGKSEIVRQQATMEIQQSAQFTFRYLPELTEAVKTNCEELESNLSKDQPDGIAMPPISVISQLYLVGSTHRDNAGECLTKLLANDHSGVSMLAADVLGKNKFTDSIEAIAKLKSNPAFQTSYGYRFNLVRSLAQMDDPLAIEILTSWRAEFDGKLRHEIDQLLDEVQEDDFAGDVDRYLAWKESIASPQTADAIDGDANAKNESAKKPTIVLQPSNTSSESLDRLRFSRKRQYYGMDLHAKRLMFIIDHSGSMEEYSAGMTRLQRAKVELIRAITDLDPETEFAIMFYETVVRTWREKLVIASEENKLEAIKFIKRLRFGDKTNTYTALRNSIEYSDDLEAVYLLTDGRPTVGPITAPTKIVHDILHRNRFKHVNFNTIGVSVSGSTETFLKTLASESGGEFRSLQ